MERELLFWSLILVAFYLVFDRTDLGMKLMVKSIAPLSMGLWWYATHTPSSWRCSPSSPGD